MYIWEFNAPEDEVVALALPLKAQTALVAFMDALVFDPWQHSANRSKNMPTVPFGDGLDGDILDPRPGSAGSDHAGSVAWLSWYDS